MAVERAQLGQPYGAPTPTLGRPLTPPRPRPSVPPQGGMPPVPGMPPGMPGMPPGPPGMPPMPDPKAAEREAIIEALGGPQVVPGTEVRSPEGPDTQPRPFSPQDSTRRGLRY